MKTLILLLLLAIACPCGANPVFLGTSGEVAAAGGGITDRVATDAYIYVHGDAGVQDTNIAVGVYNSSGTRLGASGTVTIGNTGAWRHMTFTAGPTIPAQGSTVYLVIYEDYYGTYYVSSGSNLVRQAVWESFPDTTAATIAPATDTVVDTGAFGVYITNTSGQVLAGDNSTTGKTTDYTPSPYGSLNYLSAGYTAN